MSKLKTRSSATKRFKITATGKILHKKAGKRHNLSKKSEARKRRLDIPGQISSVDRWKIERMLPYNL